MFRPYKVILRPSKKTDPISCLYHCIVGSHMHTSFCYRNIKYKIKYISFYILNLFYVL